MIRNCSSHLDAVCAGDTEVCLLTAFVCSPGAAHWQGAGLEKSQISHRGVSARLLLLPFSGLDR